MAIKLSDLASKSNSSEPKFYLRSISVVKLWGYRDFNMEFSDEVNILVGKNGSGKTTILNIISDILLLDFDALGRIRFNEIELTFFSPNTEINPVISVEKVKKSNSITDDGLRIRIYSDKNSEKPLGEQTLKYQIKTNSLNYLSSLWADSNSQRTLEPVQSNLAAFIGRLATVTWISVHRKLNSLENVKLSNFDSAVDQRIEQTNRKFSEFISELETQSRSETQEFQKKPVNLPSA